MVTIRCTRKLLDRLGTKPAGAPAPSTTHLGDWHANLLFAPGQQLVLALSDRTLLPVLLPAAPFSTLAERFAQALREVLVLLRVDGGKVEQEVAGHAPVAFARSTNRRVLGTIVDFTQALKFTDVRHSHLQALSLWLAETPCTAIGQESPDRLTASLFGAPPPERAWLRPVAGPSS